VSRRVATAELRAALEGCLGQHLGRPMRVVALDRRPAGAASSFELEELVVGLEDAPPLWLAFKNLGREALFGAARTAKPPFLHDPRREIETYRSILSPGGFGAAFVGAVCDAPTGRYWLFVEWVRGDELYAAGEFDVWLGVARWLAGFHACHAGRTEELAGRAPLLRHDGDYYRVWPRRARAVLRARGVRREVRARFDRLAQSYDRLVERLLALPPTLLHGDFYPANVLTQLWTGGVRVWPVDWELAALGPGPEDLAALVAGKWGGAERRAMALAYRDALPSAGGWPPPAEDFLTALDWCRLHVAVRWLGWSADWSPPPVQANDWLGDAVGLADRLGL